MVQKEITKDHGGLENYLRESEAESKFKNAFNHTTNKS